MSVQVTLSPLIYDGRCLDDATEVYTNLCAVAVLAVTPAGWLVEIEAPHGVDEVRVTREFLNYLLDVSLEKHLSEAQ